MQLSAYNPYLNTPNLAIYSLLALKVHLRLMGMSYILQVMGQSMVIWNHEHLWIESSLETLSQLKTTLTASKTFSPVIQHIFNLCPPPSHPPFGKRHTMDTATVVAGKRLVQLWSPLWLHHCG